MVFSQNSRPACRHSARQGTIARTSYSPPPGEKFTRKIMRTALFCLFALALLAGPQSRADSLPADQVIGEFKLNDYTGKQYALADFARAKIVVVAFLGTDCPLANRYSDRLAELAKQYAAREVLFLAIDSNQQDSLEQMAHMARTHRFEYPCLKDPGNVVADRFGAKRTPEIFVPRFRAQNSLSRPRRRSIRDWLCSAFRQKSRLAQAPTSWRERTSQPVTEPSGCFIGRVRARRARRDHLFEADRPPDAKSLCDLPPPEDWPVRVYFLQGRRRPGPERSARWF